MYSLSSENVSQSGNLRKHLQSAHKQSPIDPTVAYEEKTTRQPAPAPSSSSSVQTYFEPTRASRIRRDSPEYNELLRFAVARARRHGEPERRGAARDGDDEEVEKEEEASDDGARGSGGIAPVETDAERAARRCDNASRRRWRNTSR